jgi:hypothetical protein
VVSREWELLSGSASTMRRRGRPRSCSVYGVRGRYGVGCGGVGGGGACCQGSSDILVPKAGYFSTKQYFRGRGLRAQVYIANL